MVLFNIGSFSHKKKKHKNYILLFVKITEINVNGKQMQRQIGGGLGV